MDDQKNNVETKAFELNKEKSNLNGLKKSYLNVKKMKAKTSLKKVGRSRNQKGHKNY